jgi:hypothetical protein
MSEYQIIESKEIVWCDQDDRYIYIEKVGDDIVGLNFMQGEEFEFFKKGWCVSDPKLTKFYHAIHRYLSGSTEMDRINQAMWAYVSYRND